MALSSMTGFARSSAQSDNWTWTWEVRSVNARGLDIRCRLANGFEHLEVAARDRINKALRRGSVSLNLTVARAHGQGQVKINRGLLEQLMAMVPEVRASLGNDCRPPSVDGLLAIRGVVEPAEDEMSEDDRQALDATILAGLGRALDDLMAMRNGEGERLGAILRDHLDRIATLTGSARALAVAQPDAIKAKLREQVRQLLEAGAELPEDRLIQEAAVLATRFDPREEIDRLAAHVEAAVALLATRDPVGRKLDFLCQEFNREANTLCSKSVDTELTRIGLDLKASIDQLREQVQNLE